LNYETQPTIHKGHNAGKDLFFVEFFDEKQGTGLPAEQYATVG